MRDFLAFRTMVTPVLIQLLFWAGVVICVVIGLVYLSSGIRHDYSPDLLKGIAILLLGPLGVRIYCEIFIVFFRINATLTEIKHTLEQPQPPSGQLPRAA